MSLKKQVTGASQSSSASATMQVPIGENVIVMEKEFKTKAAHAERITDLTKVSPSEFLSSSEDCSFKVWDKDMQGCRYTIHTHQPLHTMAITGEKQNLLIAGYGEEDFIVIGIEQMNQFHISDPPAHEGKIVQIITLSKLQNKYFATRCEHGDLGIWGANKHPDRVLKIENMDDPDYAQGQEINTHRSDEAEKKAEDQPAEGEGEQEEDPVEEEEELDEDGNPIPKKEPEPVKVKKDFSNRISSDKDQMIELLDWQGIIQSSATVLAVSNYKESFVNITVIDLKMRRQNLEYTLKLSNKPTKLYQVDSDNILVGTENGKIEHWKISEETCKKIYDAHPESSAGISSIIELKTQNPLLRGDALPGVEDSSFKLIGTASEGAKEFRLWKLQLEDLVLFPYLKIETTFTEGIKYLLETQDTQLAAANESTIKFYDFIDKNEKNRAESTKKDKEELNAKMKELWLSIDKENTQKLKKTDYLKYLRLLGGEVKQFKVAADVTDDCFDDVWYEFDVGETGFVSWHSVKGFIERVEVHSEEVAEEKRIFEEERAKRLAEHQAKVEERKKRLEEMEARALAEENEEDN